MSSLKRNQSVERAAALLRALADRPEGSSAAELARAAGLTPATASRFLATLVDVGFLDRGDDDVYVLGFELARIASSADWRWRLAETARPVLERLAEEARETVTLSVVHERESELDLIAQVDPPGLVVRPDWVGRRFPLHASAAGKILLASLPPDKLERAVAQPLPRLTRRTISEEGAVMREIERARRRGFAEIVDELEEGLAALAVPVLGDGERLVAVLSLSGPSSRFDRRARAASLERLRSARAALESRLRRDGRGASALGAPRAPSSGRRRDG